MDLFLKEGLRDLQEIMQARASLREAIRRSGLSPEEFFARRRAKRLAAKVGLAYWPAIAYGPRIDPRAYAEAEQIMVVRGCARWGEVGPDGRLSHGGWDAMGYRGLSAHAVAKMWWAAGCRDSRKFRMQVRSGTVAQKGDSVTFLRAYLRGARWIDRARSAGRLWLGRKAVAALGRMPWYCRWAALHGVQSGAKPLRVRQLNWEAVRVAQKGVRAAFPFLPKMARWMHAAPDVAGFVGRLVEHLPDPHQVRLASLRRVLGKLTYPVQAADVLAAVTLVRLFGADEAALWRWVGDRSLHDAGQIVLPPHGLLPGWGGLLSAAPSRARFMAAAVQVQDLLGGRVPASTQEWRATVAKLPPSVTTWASLASLADREVRDYIALFAAGPKAFEGVPAPGGADGIRSGKYHLLQLAHNDPLQPLAGRLVNCCQHLHAAAASCARSAWFEGDAAIWAVFKGSTMVAQTFVWRSRNGRCLVLDSVECLNGHRSHVAPLFVAAAKAAVGRLSVERVFIGDTGYGASREVAELANAGEPQDAPKCAFALPYTDARRVRLLCEAKVQVAGKMVRMAVRAAVQAARQQVEVQARNELVPGSGVFCEHCDAEVHPDAETCPACGADIAEWVDE